MLRKIGPVALVLVAAAIATASYFNHRRVIPMPPRVVRAATVAPPEPASALIPPDPGDRYVRAQGRDVLLHAVRKGETTGGLVRRFWPVSEYMTHAEFTAALHAANPSLKGEYLKPGSEVSIPGLEPQPVREQPVAVPRDFEVRAIYLTGIMAGSERGMKLIERWAQGGGNAVVFDVKDSDGSINIPFSDPLAPKRHPAIPNLPKFVRWMHHQHLHVIARIAIFRDELLVTRHPELAVVSRKNGQPWRENGKLVWTDPSLTEVQNYNIALARAAAAAGVDEVQFDYVRFPAEGDQADARFSFQAAHPSWTRADVIADFLHRAHEQLRSARVLLSLDVFGVMAWQRPVDLSHTGQDIVRMAKECDVLSPMIYPSHFFKMDGYANPGDAPEHFIGESMDRFVKITAGTGVVIRPWLQAFAWRTRTYSPAYILTQVSVARQRGGDGFLLWNARNDYAKPFTAMATMVAQPQNYFAPVARTSGAAGTAAGRH